jgi:hypothetical protein
MGLLDWTYFLCLYSHGVSIKEFFMKSIQLLKYKGLVWLDVNS